jgi:hypothetical protein
MGSNPILGMDVCLHHAFAVSNVGCGIATGLIPRLSPTNRVCYQETEMEQSFRGRKCFKGRNRNCLKDVAF